MADEPASRLETLRSQFPWLGPEGKYISALDEAAGVVTIQIMRATWVRRTAAYEALIVRDFAALGLRVTWQPFWSERLENRIAEARKAAQVAGTGFDEQAFVLGQQEQEEAERVRSAAEYERLSARRAAEQAERAARIARGEMPPPAMSTPATSGAILGPKQQKMRFEARALPDAPEDLETEVSDPGADQD